MSASRCISEVRRRSAYGTFVEDIPAEFPDGHCYRLKLIDGPPTTTRAFPAAVYTIDENALLVVNEPMTFLQHAALLTSETPSWANAIVGATVLSEENEVPPRIEVDILRPSDVDPATAAFAAACASYDQALHDADPIDCLVRVLDDVFRVEASTKSRTWSGTVESATESERGEMSRWRLYRSLNTQSGWNPHWGLGAFDGSTFLRVADLIERAPMEPFSVVQIDGRAIAIFQSTTRELQAQLARASRPAWIDAVVTAELVTPPNNPRARIEVASIEPSDMQAVSVAAAVALDHRLQGRFEVQLDDCTVCVAGEEIRCTIGHDEDRDPSRVLFWVRTRPVAR